MDDIEGPVCTVCHEDYDEQVHIPRIFKCGHSICALCLTNLLNANPACPTCRAPCARNENEIPRNYQLLDTITLQKTLKTDNTVLLKDKSKLTKDYQDLASKYEELVDKEKAREKDAVICGECKKQDTESDIQICRTCAIEKFKWDFVQTVQNESSLELPELAVCSTCAIRKHYKSGHEVLDFYPIQTAHQYAVHVANLNVLRNDSRVLIGSLKEEVAKLMQTIRDGEDELDRMTDMIRRGKSTRIQQNFVRKIEKQINEQSEFITKVNNYVNDTTSDMKAMIVTLAAENKEISERDCVPENDISINGLLNGVLGIGAKQIGEVETDEIPFILLD